MDDIGFEEGKVVFLKFLNVIAYYPFSPHVAGQSKLESIVEMEGIVHSVGIIVASYIEAVFKIVNLLQGFFHRTSILVNKSFTFSSMPIPYGISML